MLAKHPNDSPYALLTTTDCALVNYHSNTSLQFAAASGKFANTERPAGGPAGRAPAGKLVVTEPDSEVPCQTGPWY